MGKKNKRRDKEGRPGSRISRLRAERREEQKDQKRADKHWNNSAMQRRQRQPQRTMQGQGLQRPKSQQQQQQEEQKFSASSNKSATGYGYKTSEQRNLRTSSWAAGRPRLSKQEPTRSNGISPEIQALDALGLANSNLNNQLAQAQNDYASRLRATSDAGNGWIKPLKKPLQPCNAWSK